MTITRNTERFSAIDFKITFLKKMETFFKKLGYCFLVESNAIYIVPISYKTDHTKDIAKTIKLWSTNFTYNKERCFTTNCLIFSKIKSEHKKLLYHCVKSVRIRICFWSVFTCVRTEYGDFFHKFPYSVRTQENKDQKKLRIWTLFTQFILLFLCNSCPNLNIDDFYERLVYL